MTVCRTTQYVIYVTAYVSIYTLVLMAGDRSVSCGMWHFVIHWESTVNINPVQIPGGGVPGVLPHHEDGGQREVPDPGHLAPHPPLQHPALAHTQHPPSGQQ